MGWPSVVLIHGGSEVMRFDIVCQYIRSQLLAFLLIAVDGLEGIEFIAKDFLGCGQVAGAITHLIERFHLETLIGLLQVHQARVTATRNAFQRVTYLVVVEHPVVAPHKDVCCIVLVNSHDVVDRYTMLSFRILFTEYASVSFS